jgi:dihydrofolate synthase/folylpolyglutamate synthase
MDWAEASAWYNDLEKYGSKPGLEVVSELAHQLGDPQRSLRAIHVSGTNGKGSTCAYAASIMHAAKLCVGLFTSPHLSIFTESVQVNGEKIGEANCARLLTRVRAECEAMEQKEFRHPTIFEVLTVLAFTWFAESRVDVAVVEVGMGGKLDATNIIDADVAVVTNVSLEHTAWLGNTVAKIANVKAGIVKRGATLITAARDPEVLDVLRAVATRQEARLVEVGRDVTMGLDREDMEGQIFTVRTRKGEYKLETRLLGAHQIVNAATAIAACEALAEGWLPLTHHMVEQGISTTRWPGRDRKSVL